MLALKFESAIELKALVEFPIVQKALAKLNHGLPDNVFQICTGLTSLARLATPNKGICFHSQAGNACMEHSN